VNFSSKPDRTDYADAGASETGTTRLVAGKDQGRDALQGRRDAKWSLQDARRSEHRPADRGGKGPDPRVAHQAWAVYSGCYQAAPGRPRDTPNNSSAARRAGDMRAAVTVQFG
jgi:hypothetical protein